VILLVSFTMAVIFGAAAYLMLKRDLIRVIAGMILLGNAANLFIMAAGLRRGEAPILGGSDTLSDSLVQAMTLTAVVISFGVATLVLSLVYRVYEAHRSIDLTRLGTAETTEATRDDQPAQPSSVASLASDPEAIAEPDLVVEEVRR
jgi:multicomponent Na+:H+ antiporter subunit C